MTVASGEETPPTPARRGRPATASREDVLRLVREQFLNGERVDLTVVAARLGLGRATIYRWFGSREMLLGQVIADELERLHARKRREVRRRGAEGLLEVFDRINRTLTRSQALRRLLEQERDSAMRLLTSSGGLVQPRAVACTKALIDAEVLPGATRLRLTPRRSPTRSCVWPRRSCTTTWRLGSVATTSACARSRPRCWGSRIARAAGRSDHDATRGSSTAAGGSSTASTLGRPVRPRPDIDQSFPAPARSAPWMPLGHTSMATISTTP